VIIRCDFERGIKGKKKVMGNLLQNSISVSTCLSNNLSFSMLFKRANVRLDCFSKSMGIEK